VVGPLPEDGITVGFGKRRRSQNCSSIPLIMALKINTSVHPMPNEGKQLHPFMKLIVGNQIGGHHLDLRFRSSGPSLEQDSSIKIIKMDETTYRVGECFGGLHGSHQASPQRIHFEVRGVGGRIQQQLDGSLMPSKADIYTFV